MYGLSGYCLRLATSCDVCRRLRTALAVDDFCCRSQRRWRRRLSVSSVASRFRRVVRGDRAAWKWPWLLVVTMGWAADRGTSLMGFSVVDRDPCFIMRGLSSESLGEAPRDGPLGLPR